MKKVGWLLVLLFAFRDGKESAAAPSGSPTAAAARALAPSKDSSSRDDRTSPEPSESETATAERGELQLSRCVLTFKAAPDAPPVGLKVDLPKPCRFARTKSGAPQSVKTNKGETFMVVSSRPKGRDCDTRVRAVVLSRSGLLISTKKKALASCSTEAFDAKLFHVLAASSQKPR